MSREEIEYCLKRFHKNKHGFLFENGLKISLYDVFKILKKLQDRIDKAQDLIRNETSLNDSEIDELSMILEGDYDE